MPTRAVTALSALLWGLLACGHAWGGELPDPAMAPGRPSPTSPETRAPSFPESPAPSALAPAASSAPSRLAARLDLSAAYREHAPLAWFSLGSLAVGGVFYAIGQGFDRPNVSYAAGSRSQMAAAVALAGTSALLAAGSYFYYAHKTGEGEEAVSDWEASLRGAPDGSGGLSVAARVSLGLPSFR
jgi:hypothetical protein